MTRLHRIITARIKRVTLVVVATLFLCTTVIGPPRAWAYLDSPGNASSESIIQSYIDGTSWYDSTPQCGQPGLGPTLDGHTLPAGTGGMGREADVNELGQIPGTNEYLAFSGNIRSASTAKDIPDPYELATNPNADPATVSKVSMQDLYRDYYITMRWRYRLWSWNGSSTTGPESVDFYSQAPRVLVTNPRTGKSIVAVVLEAGPAPWTGVLVPPNDIMNGPTDTRNAWLNERAPDYWKEAVDGTPAGYKGRVSGFPPKAMQYLGATMKMYDGTGDDLVYSWAPDQHAAPGPFLGETQDPTDVVDVACPVPGLPTGEYIRDSSSMTCPVGKDAGIGDGYANGRLYKIRLCQVRGFRVNVLVAQQVDRILSQIETPGNDFSGGGFRTMEEQIHLRQVNGCPNIYTAPSSSCVVPTARPGYSNHQMGLAIDFSYNGSLIRSHSNTGFQLLSQYAGPNGFKNFPAEPWHWSVDGR